ncbi:hypothetical protein [Metabacillus sp. B2-18]|uniref:hypothetical protein n=1 Tax=Metabacillus sp. B2-18 TaxID=2897333 RepID=UPI001E392961|nr:hypothetical protein [Metabacillus sp. B2-18]UGB30537.1 hypothetical protein LPC09_23040 [Metabacillus sp. B2-18]
MKIINRKELENLFETLHPKLDLSNIITVEDEELSQVLHYFLFLKQFIQDIVANSPFNYCEVLYSRYYWFVYFKNNYFVKFGYDGGMVQQAFMLIEDLTHELDGEVDWELLEKINNELKTDY